MTTVPSATSPATTTGASSAQQQLAGNFDTFLTLLTTQLQNQDPLSPMDSNQFTQQLVQFSQVEQQINTNDNLKTLINQGTSANSAYAVSYLGKAVTVSNGNAPLANGQAVWAYNLNTDASQTQLTVTDAKGNVVYTGAGETGSGAHVFDWDGKDNGGNQLSDGTYKLTVTAKAADGSAVTNSVTSTGAVSEVDMTGSTPLLMVGPMSVSLTDVVGVQSL
ncbi:MAG: flagellar hook assembly protein FlgD [Proteobacteria bacterium]|nr:flagellar hook assembly protein FlgD [Pseudomonadota bacterium]